MQKEQLEMFKEWLTDFVRGFYTADDDFLNANIQLKECHTHRVCNEMRQLTVALKMDDSDTLLAEAIALLHDVGKVAISDLILKKPSQLSFEEYDQREPFFDGAECAGRTQSAGDLA